MKLNQAVQVMLAVSRIRALNWSKQHLKDLPDGVMDPQMSNLLKVMNYDATVKPMWEKSITQSRADHILNMVIYRRFSPPIAKVPNVWNGTIPGPHGDIKVRYYMPLGNGPFPIFVYCHGGGWVLGNLNTADNVARALCHYGQMAVISVDYRLAPEHKFPVPLEDCYAVCEWASDAENAKTVRGNVQKLVVGGDSAGGNLAAAVCLKARDENGPRIAQQVLMYPALNARDTNTESYRTYGDQQLLTAADMRWFYDQYVDQEQDRINPYLSPLLAEDHSNLPPALILTAEFDVLRAEGEQYAHALKAAGVDVEHIHAAGLSHAFMTLREMVKRADRYSEQLMKRLRKRLGE